MSKEQKDFLKKIKRNKIIILMTQISIFILFILIWQILSNKNIINTFITSSPKKILITIKNLYIQNNLFTHIFVTVKETLISFVITSILSLLISIILYNHSFIAKVLDPYLTILNSLPKVALGPILIIWIGANVKSIIFMALLIATIISIITILNGFNSTDQNKIKLMKSLNASKWQIYKMIILRGNLNTIVSSLKINVSMCLIGIIMGELLVSKEGIGYLIMYGSQVFNLNLVMTGIILLALISYILYFIVCYIEKKLVKN